jgi:hypothetical protein
MLVGCQCGRPASGQRYEGRTGPRHQAVVKQLSSVKSAQRRPLVGSSTSDTTSETRSMPAFRSVVSVLVSFVGRSFSTNSRPASGRPPAAAVLGRQHHGRTGYLGRLYHHQRAWAVLASIAPGAADEIQNHRVGGWSGRFAGGPRHSVCPRVILGLRAGEGNVQSTLAVAMAG